MTLPLNDVSAIVCRCAAHIQALAAVLRDEARVAVRRGLETKCLIVASIAGPLNDRQTVIERPLRYIEALLTVTCDELVEARYRERPQEACERPVRDVRTLCARHSVRESKVNAVENASLDDIIGGGREPLVRACLVDSLSNGAGQREGQFIRPEEIRKHRRHRARRIVRSGRVVRIVGCSDERLPRDVGRRVCVAVVVSLTNSRNRPPEVPEALRVP